MYRMIPCVKLCLKSIPIIKRRLQLSFLPVSITPFLSLARFVCLEEFRVTKHGTLRAPSSICQAGSVHPDQCDKHERWSAENGSEGRGREPREHKQTGRPE